MWVLEWQEENALSWFAWETDGVTQRGLIHHRLSLGIFHPQFWTKGGFLPLLKPCMGGKP